MAKVTHSVLETSFTNNPSAPIPVRFSSQALPPAGVVGAPLNPVPQFPNPPDGDLIGLVNPAAY